MCFWLKWPSKIITMDEIHPYHLSFLKPPYPITIMLKCWSMSPSTPTFLQPPPKLFTKNHRQNVQPSKIRKKNKHHHKKNPPPKTPIPIPPPNHSIPHSLRVAICWEISKKTVTCFTPWGKACTKHSARQRCSASWSSFSQQLLETPWVESIEMYQKYGKTMGKCWFHGILMDFMALIHWSLVISWV